MAVPCPVFGPLTYTSDHEIARGVRVLVPLGKRQVVGVALGNSEQSEDLGFEDKKLQKKSFILKDIAAVIDHEPIFSEVLLKMGQWMASYYHQPLGEVFKAMLPASKVRGRKPSPDEAAEPPSPLEQEGLQVKKQRKKTSAPPWRVFPLRSSPAEFCTGEQEQPGLTTQAPPAPPLTEEQATALRAISELSFAQQEDAPKPFLLHGVTGSGKTEVYLQAIADLHRREWFEAGSLGGKPQVLVLVPEISLTPQMTQVFTRRFPGETAVVHSGLSDKNRWEQLSAIYTGQASILIGPRSAVFAPFHSLRLLIVDEEHDGSYKQASNPPYQGRDMAIVRAKLEKAAIILGSATPSLESFANAQAGRYHLLNLSQRVYKQAMPHIHLVAQANKRAGLLLGPSQEGRVTSDDLDPGEVFAPEVIAAIAETLQQGEQGMIIVNRRGFAPFLLDLSRGEAMQCPHCSISLTFHSTRGLARCHYCDFSQSIAQLSAQHAGSKICAVGHGSQKVELLRAKLFPAARIVRCDSDSVAAGKNLGGILDDFRAHNIDLLVGTQLLAKGHDFPNVTLMVLLEIDGMLNLPDFRAGERTFQLLVQAAGRAGRAEKPGRVLVQTQQAESRVIQAALQHNYRLFAEGELAFRQRFHYPPSSKLALIELSSSREIEVAAAAATISSWLKQLAAKEPPLFQQLRILGPAIPAIAKVRQNFRRTLVLIAVNSSSLHGFIRRYLAQFPRQGSQVRQHLDIDPQNLL